MKKKIMLLIFCNIFYSCNDFEYKKYDFEKINDCHNGVQLALRSLLYYSQQKVDRGIYYKRKGYYAVGGSDDSFLIRKKKLKVLEHIESIESLREKNNNLFGDIAEKIRLKMRQKTSVKNLEKDGCSLIDMSFIEKELIELRKYNIMPEKLAMGMRVPMLGEIKDYIFNICSFFDKYDFKNKNDKIPINLVENYIICVYLNQNIDYLDYLVFIPNGIDYPYL